MRPLVEQVDSKPFFSIYNYNYEDVLTSIPYNSEIGEEIKQTGNIRIIAKKIREGNEEMYEIYTDGSKVKGTNSVGAACFCPQLDVKITKSINPKSSVFTAECIALNDALELALRHTDQTICIFTDCLSALEALNRPKLLIKDNDYLLQIRKKFNEFKNRSTFAEEPKLYWIPSHMGIFGNEEVDQLAKSATEVIRPEISRIPFTDFKEGFRIASKKNTSEQLRDQGALKGKNYFDNFFDNSSKPWFYKYKKLKRNTIVWINRLRANHYNLKSSLARIGIISDPAGECGHPEEDVDHIVWQCPRFTEQRKRMEERIVKLCPTPRIMSNILYNMNPIVIKSIDKFLIECELRI
ncbi:uncharacterized protein [Fopius arisanus]|uniref:ribonuclease H n=1 Tax=Fopius arisanus TaxID=64838 RepID=A0A9R1SYX5_9HYME|nr:PREDICTED: uncharacterized protein LOC105264520 [Fopius arisanus]